MSRTKKILANANLKRTNSEAGFSFQKDRASKRFNPLREGTPKAITEIPIKHLATIALYYYLIPRFGEQSDGDHDEDSSDSATVEQDNLD